MPVPSTGPISLNDFHVEAGGTSGTQAAINDQDIRDLIGKASGVQMSFSEWYGATAGPSPSAITSPTRLSDNLSNKGFAYLKDNGDGNGDVMFAGAVDGAPMKYMQFGTNNRLSTWSTSSQPTKVNMPSMRYSTGNRAFSATRIAGTRKFVTVTENWLGYSTGMAVACYEMNGASSAPTKVGGWTQLYNDQTTSVAVYMDPFNPGNGVVINNYTNFSPYNYIRAYAFQVDTSTNAITARGSFWVASNAGDLRSGLYVDGRLLIRGNSPDGIQNYLYSCLMNTSTGALSSGPTRNGPPGGTQLYSWNREYDVPELFRLSDGTILWAYRDDSGGSPYAYKITRLSFSGNSISFNNTVTTGLNIQDDNISYMIGEEEATSGVDSIYLSGTRTSDNVGVGQKWTWTGSAISKTYEDTSGFLSTSITGGIDDLLNTYMASQGGIPQYTADDNVFLQGQPTMPYYWSHK